MADRNKGNLLIEPVWNRNSVTGPAAVTLQYPFNRTSLESEQLFAQPNRLCYKRCIYRKVL